MRFHGRKFEGSVAPAVAFSLLALAGCSGDGATTGNEEGGGAGVGAAGASAGNGGVAGASTGGAAGGAGSGVAGAAGGGAAGQSGGSGSGGAGGTAITPPPPMMGSLNFTRKTLHMFNYAEGIGIG